MLYHKLQHIPVKNGQVSLVAFQKNYKSCTCKAFAGKYTAKGKNSLK